MPQTTETRPLFTGLDELAQTITRAIHEQQRLGMRAQAVHINPKMLEIMDQMAGVRITHIGEYPVAPDATVPLDRFRLRLPHRRSFCS
jgi:hypothetical protein